MLSREMERYVALQRAAGFAFDDQTRVLQSFVAFATAAGDRFIRADRVLDWSLHAPQRRRTLLLTVRRFALALAAEDPRHEVPSADILARARVERRSPYIYSDEEIRALIRGAARVPVRGQIPPAMYPTLFGLLAATGLRISEALALDCADLVDDRLIIRETKRKASRLVPLHETTARALASYMTARIRHAGQAGALFLSGSRARLSYGTVGNVFARLARSIGLQPAPGGPSPRIHDLRHSFAVRSLEGCGHDRAAVARHIVALSTYLGHVRVSDTYWYLEATPVLMRQIAEAGEILHERGAP